MGRVALVLTLALLFVPALRAQVVTGAITGRVADTTGAVIPAATVEVQNVETGFSRATQADASGRFVVRNLPLGAYAITARHEGFRTEIRRGVTLTVGSEVVVNMELSVGTVQETVEVTSEAPLVETTNANVSGLVSPEQMRDLPLNGRSFDQLALLHSGVVSQPFGSRNQTQGSGFRLSAGGGRADSNSYLLDGTVVNDHSSQGPGSATGQTLGVEAVREFRILTHNFSAEYGRNSGAVISAVTRSGTNEFHGSAYEFLRNNVLDARNFFNPGELPPFRRNQFGGALGGPVLRDKMFFFANYEGLRDRRGVTSISFVPDQGSRSGLIPNPATGVPRQVQVSPVAKPYLDMYPLPNGRNFGNGIGENIVDTGQRSTENYAMERMDFRLTDADSFYWRYVFNPSDSVVPRPLPIFEDADDRTNHFVTMSETHVFSGAALNDFRFGFNRTDSRRLTGPLDINPALDFAPGRGFGTLRFRSAGGSGSETITELGTSAATPQIFVQNLFQATDSFSYLKGAHSLKFGVDFQREQINTDYASRQRGEYQFNSLEDFLLARAARLEFHLLGKVGEIDGTGQRGWRRVLFGWFAQDDYRVTQRLTLNLGIRHEFVTAPSEVNGRSANLRNVATDAFPTQGPPFEAKIALFAPRTGLAWDPTGSGKTSIRLGAGLYFNHVMGRTWYFFSGDDMRYRARIITSNPPFPNAPTSGAINTSSLATKNVQYELDTPSVVHYTMEVQRQLAPALSARLGFVGSHGYNMTRNTAQNNAVSQTLADGTKFFPANSPRRNPNISEIAMLTTDAVSNYNAFQAELTKAMSGGLQLKAAYTLSKTLSDSDTISNSQILTTAPVPLDLFDLDRDYSRSVYDQRHTFVLSGHYRMPWDNLLTSGVSKALLGGWAANSIFQYGSGFPFNLQVGFNNARNLDSDTPDRPNLATGASHDPRSGATAGCRGVAGGQTLGTPDMWFDSCAFELPAVGTYGNLGRNTVTGPKFVNVDFALTKDTALGERASLQFRAEFFNILNHANFGTPTNLVFDASREHTRASGRITSTVSTNREIQFGLRLTF